MITIKELRAIQERVSGRDTVWDSDRTAVIDYAKRS